MSRSIEFFISYRSSKFILGFLLFNVIFHLFVVEMRFFNNKSIHYYTLLRSLHCQSNNNKKLAFFHSLTTVHFGQEISIPRHVHIFIMICRKIKTYEWNHSLPFQVFFLFSIKKLMLYSQQHNFVVNDHVHFGI